MSLLKSASSSAGSSASGDPFYVFKDELESKVSALHQKYAKWKSVWDAPEASSRELPSLTSQISAAVASAEKSLKFLEQTIVMVEANRSKFDHIDNAEIASRKAFVSSTRMELMSVSSEITSDAVKARVRREEQKQLKPLPKKIESRPSDDNARFMEEETQRQQQIMREQDQSLEGIGNSVANLKHVAVTINHEIKDQNKMLDDLTDDVDEAQERMNFVMDRMSKLLKTKDRCQLGLIIFLMLVLVVMVFLVIYT